MAERMPGQQFDRTDGQQPRVLLVDDEKDFLEVITKRLERRGVRVRTASGGEAALAALAAEPADVVVLDVKMPGMDGMQALDRIKANWPTVEVIMLTGHAELEAAMDGLQKGAFDYLMKPVEMDHLLYRIQDAWKRKTLHEEEERQRRTRDTATTGGADGGGA